MIVLLCSICTPTNTTTAGCLDDLHMGKRDLAAAPPPDRSGLPVQIVVRHSARVKGVPLYYQVMRVLKEGILSGRHAPGDRLASETELMETFKVSRTVVRQSLKILEDEDLIVRLKGKGTFVADDVAGRCAPILSGDIEDLMRAELATEVKVLKFDLVRAAPDVAAVFGLDPGTDVVHVKLLRLVDGRPFAVIEGHLLFQVGKLIPPALLETEPLMQLVEKWAAVEIDSAHEVWDAVAAEAELASLLEIDMMAPVLKMTLTVFALDGRVVSSTSAYHRPDRYHHRGYLRRRRTGNRPGWTPIESDGSVPPDRSWP